MQLLSIFLAVLATGFSFASDSGRQDSVPRSRLEALFLAACQRQPSNLDLILSCKGKAASLCNAKEFVPVETLIVDPRKAEVAQGLAQSGDHAESQDSGNETCRFELKEEGEESKPSAVDEESLVKEEVKSESNLPVDEIPEKRSSQECYASDNDAVKMAEVVYACERRNGIWRPLYIPVRGLDYRKRKLNPRFGPKQAIPVDLPPSTKLEKGIAYLFEGEVFRKPSDAYYLSVFSSEEEVDSGSEYEEPPMPNEGIKRVIATRSQVRRKSKKARQHRK